VYWIPSIVLWLTAGPKLSLGIERNTSERPAQRKEKKNKGKRNGLKETRKGKERKIERKENR
jgi:hypothetical protein